MNTLKDEFEFIEIKREFELFRNPTVSAISYSYQNDFLIKKEIENKIDNSRKETYIPLSNLNIPYNSPLEETNTKSTRIKLFVSNAILLLIVILLLSTVVEFIKIGGFFPMTGNYWLYPIFGLSIFSLFLTAFYKLGQIFNYKKYNVINYELCENIFSYSLPTKCPLRIAIEDVSNIIQQSYIPYSSRRSYNYPYLDDYPEKASKKIEQIQKTCTFDKKDYVRYLHKINESPSIVTTISLFIIGLLSNICNAIYLWQTLGNNYHVNIILNALCCVGVSYLIVNIFQPSLYKKNIVTLDAILYVYEYQHLNMPYYENYTHVDLDISTYTKTYNKGEIIHYIHQWGKSNHRFGYRDIVKLEENTIRIYGIDDFNINEILNEKFSKNKSESKNIDQPKIEPYE